MITLAPAEGKKKEALMKRIIPENEVEFDTMRSGGAGGQSVNTTDSAARGIWNIDKYFTGTPEEKARVIEYLKKNHPKHLKENELGEQLLQAKSQTQKSQLQNKGNALERMNELMAMAMEVREERVEVIPKKVKDRADRKRLDEKKAESMKKKLRGNKDKWAM